MASLLTLVLLLLITSSVFALEFQIVENSGENYHIGRINTVTATSFTFGGPTRESCENYLSISDFGDITTKVNIDREEVVKTTGSDNLICLITHAEQNHEQTTELLIVIIDENDNEPRFFELNQPEIRTILENIDVPAEILRLEPVDSDEGQNAMTEFYISAGNEDGYFLIGVPMGGSETSSRRVLFLNRSLPYSESHSHFNLTIVLRDMGDNPKIFEQTILIDVVDSQDTTPAFAVTTVMYTVPEDHPIGPENPFAQISVLNSDITIEFSVTETSRTSEPHSTVGINITTGELYLLTEIDYESQSEDLEFYIYAYNPDVHRDDNVFGTLTVTDINDNGPQLFLCNFRSACPPVEITENIVDQRLATVLLTDSDLTPEFKKISTNISFVSSNPDIRNLDITVDGLTVNVELPEPLDRERVTEFSLEITFFSEAEPHQSVSVTMDVSVLDENDNPPKFENDSYTLKVAEGSPIGKEIGSVQATDLDLGENGTVSHSITRVEPSQALNWFTLTTSGMLILKGSVNFTTVAGIVNVTISATDNGTSPLVSNITAQIKISPTLTFTPNSYAQFAEFDIVNSNIYTIYLEVRTMETHGIILYQDGGVSLELNNGELIYRHGASTITSSSAVSDNRWYTVLIKQNPNNPSIETREINDRQAAETQLLLQSSITQCSTSVPTNPLYIGGVNLFSLDDDSRPLSHDFIGTIRSVLINNTQIDLGCPYNQINTAQGFFYSDFCGSASSSLCENDHTTGCVDYAPEPYCSCLGGFPPASCQPISDPDPEVLGADNSFAPIRFHANTKADLTLDYSFFSDLQQARARDIAAISGRKKRLVPTNATIQTVTMSFKMVSVHTSVLLFARTPTTINKLLISVTDTESIIYTVHDASTNAKLLEIPVELSLQKMMQFSVRVTITESMVLLSVSSNGVYSEQHEDWVGDARPFVEQPTSTLGIGGADDEMGYFEGCISHIAIDSIEIPLSGLLALSPEEGGFVSGGNATRLPDMYCDLCDLQSCQNNSHCVREVTGEPRCACNINFEPDDAGKCIPDSSTLPVFPLTENLQIVIGASVGGGVVIIALLLSIILLRVCLKKRDRQKRTYSVTNVNGSTPSNNNSNNAKPNAYVHTQLRARDSLVNHTTPNGTPRHDRGSSVSTFQEHAEDGDPDFETIPRRASILRRKSTASAESGIKTDTEMSYPRMEDSGNEKETDYSEHDSVSDDMSSTFYPHSAISPHLMITSPVASSVSSPHTLTPKERQIITPLRPASTALSASEFEGGDTDVDVFHFGHHTLPASLSRNSSGRRSGRIESDSGGDTSRVSSSCSSAKWYKASTASDAERERERSHANRAFFTQRSEPLSRYSEESDYQTPPTFQPKSAGAVPYPNTRRSRMPINLSESPVSRTEEKPDMYQLPYAASKPSPAHNPRLSYDNHRLKHEYSLPKGHPNIALSTTSSSSGRPRHNADAMLASAYPAENAPYPASNTAAYPPQASTGYPRFLSTSGGPGSSIPHHTTHFQYSRSYSEDKSRKQPEQRFQDLKSVAKINPIAFWEMQDRMNKTAVDQVDPYHILSEPYIPFEDVSTDPSVIESQITQDGPEHQHFSSQGGGETRANMLGPELSIPDTIITETDSTAGQMMPVFPSADCSSQYTATLEADSGSTSGTSTPKTPNVFTLQSHYDV